MKYKLLKKIEGIDWGVGETVYRDRKGLSTLNGIYAYLASHFDIHNLLLNGTIEKVEENKVENKRWRAEKREIYWYVYQDTQIDSHIEIGDTIDEDLYKIGNYFQTESQAQAVADKIKQLLKESHE